EQRAKRKGREKAEWMGKQTSVATVWRNYRIATDTAAATKERGRAEARPSQNNARGVVTSSGRMFFGESRCRQDSPFFREFGRSTFSRARSWWDDRFRRRRRRRRGTAAAPVCRRRARR